MGRFVRRLAVVALVALAVLAWTFAPATLAVADLELEALPPASPPAEMSISALPTGAMLSRAVLAYRGGSLAEEREFAMTAILVRHPRGNLLFDAGLGRDVDDHVETLPALMRATTTLRKDEPAGARLARHGFDLATLAGVVPTHAHWDHVSGLDSLPGVPLWMNEAERAFVATGAPQMELLRRIGPPESRGYDFDDGPYLGYPRSHDVWNDGSVVLVPAPGHTPGSIIAFLSLPSGARYALLGDLVWQSEGIEIPAERPWLARRLVDVDAEAVRAEIGRVAAIHRRFPEIRMLPAHDARAMAALPVFPDAAR